MSNQDKKNPSKEIKITESFKKTLSAIMKERGKKGGLARAKKLSPKKQSENGKLAAKARWSKK